MIWRIHFLIYFGIFFILIWQRNNPLRIAFAEYTASNDKCISNKRALPKTIRIRDLGIDLPISESQIVDQKWEVSDNSVSHLESSPLPGEVGNSILYGHNWNNLLGNITKAKEGQELSVIFNDGSEKKFVIKYLVEVDYDQKEVLAPSQDRRITIYTCTGFLDYKRFVVTALLSADASSCRP
jgi:LPXTG-site transpeptidase (sortase) family protein